MNGSPGRLWFARSGCAARFSDRSWSLAVLVVAMLGASVGAYAQDRVGDAVANDPRFREGVQQLERGDFEAAEASFRVVVHDTGDSRAAYNLAEALAGRGRLVEARDVLTAIVADPRSDLLVVDAARLLLEELSPRIAALPVENRADDRGAGDVRPIESRSVAPGPRPRTTRPPASANAELGVAAHDRAPADLATSPPAARHAALSFDDTSPPTSSEAAPLIAIGAGVGAALVVATVIAVVVAAETSPRATETDGGTFVVAGRF